MKDEGMRREREGGGKGGGRQGEGVKDEGMRREREGGEGGRGGREGGGRGRE